MPSYPIRVVLFGSMSILSKSHIRDRPNFSCYRFLKHFLFLQRQEETYSSSYETAVYRKMSSASIIRLRLQILSMVFFLVIFVICVIPAIFVMHLSFPLHGSKSKSIGIRVSICLKERLIIYTSVILVLLSCKCRISNFGKTCQFCLQSSS